MTDDEIVAAVDRRFAVVEGRLPPQRLELIATESPLIERVRGRHAWNRSLAGVLGVAVVAVAVVALAVSGRPHAAPGHVGDGSTSAPPPTSTPIPSTSASGIPGLEVLRGSGDGSELIANHLGWSRCRRVADVLMALPDLDAIDRAADAAGIEEGWLQLPGSRALIGPSAERAAVARGATILAYGGRDTWVLIDGRAHQLEGFRTPAGRTLWIMADSMQPLECPPDVDATAPPAPPTPTIDPAHRSIEVDLDVFRTDWNAAAPGLAIDAFKIADTGEDDMFSVQIRPWMFVHGQVWPDGSIRTVFVQAEPSVDGPLDTDDPRWDETRLAMTALIRAAAPHMTPTELERVVAELGIANLTTGEPTDRTIRTHGLAISTFGAGQPGWSLRIQDANDPEA